MTMSRRRRREEEEDDPEPDASSGAHDPGRKRRRRRRPAPAAVAALGATGDAEVEDVDDATMGRSGRGGSTAVVVSGLPCGCTVLELKSRMLMYGAVSRIRIDAGEGLGYVTYRSPDSARAAVSASADPAFGIAIGSTRVHVSQVSDLAPQRHTGAGLFAPSKLLRAETPLRKHGRGNKKLSEGMTSTNRSIPEMPYEGRQIVAYDDLL